MQRADEAVGVVQRATEMLRTAERAAGAVANVDHAITTHRALEMKKGGKLGSLPAHLVEAKRICNEAQGVVQSSRAALVSLQDEQAVADEAEAAAHVAVTQAAVQVLVLEGVTLAGRLARLTRERETVLAELADLSSLWVPLEQPRRDAFGNEVTLGPIQMPAVVVETLNPPLQTVHVPKPEVWAGYLQRLQGDPDASRLG